jgi:hypothetical protein
MIIPEAQYLNEMTIFGDKFGSAHRLVSTRKKPHQIASLIAKQLSAGTKSAGGVDHDSVKEKQTTGRRESIGA